MQSEPITPADILSNAEGLPSASQHAFSFTADSAATYLNAHFVAGLRPELATTIAAGRLQWVLKLARRGINDVFTVEDIALLSG